MSYVDQVMSYLMSYMYWPLIIIGVGWILIGIWRGPR